MPAYELNFRDYLRILQKRYWILLLCSVISTVGFVIYSGLHKPQYRAVVTVRIEEHKTFVGSLMNQPVYYYGGGNYLVSEMRVIRSRVVAEEATRRLGWIKEGMTKAEIDNSISATQALISVEQEEKTDIVRIIVTSEDAQHAAKLANIIALVYQEENLKQKNREARKSREFIEQQLAKVEQKLKASEDTLKIFKEKEIATGVGLILTNRLAELQGELTKILAKATEKHPDVLRVKDQIASFQQQLKELPESELEYVRLSRDVEVNDKLYRTLRDKVEEARIVEAEKVSDVTIVSPSGAKGFMIGPSKRNSLLIGFLIGAIIGLALMFIFENLDTSIASIEEVENYIKLPVLGVIPSFKIEKDKESDELSKRRNIVFIVGTGSHSYSTEAFRILRTNLKVEKDKKKALLITSTGPQEGKSTILIGLGLVFSQMGIKTLLVDSDLRRPAISKIFGLEREPGLNELLTSGPKYSDTILRNFTDILMGELGYDFVRELAGLENLNIVTSGALTTNSSEILGSLAMENFLAEMRKRFDVVLFDSPPALSVTDASILSKNMDGVIIVYEMGRTSREALLRTKLQLESVGAKILGVVLNHTKPQTEFQTSYYSYYYSSYKYDSDYSDKGEKKEKEKGGIA